MTNEEQVQMKAMRELVAFLFGRGVRLDEDALAEIERLKALANIATPTKEELEGGRVCVHCGYPMSAHTFEEYEAATIVICPEAQ